MKPTIFLVIGIVLILCGAILNFSVMFFNNGFMPVYDETYPDTVYYEKHKVVNNLTGIKFPHLIDKYNINNLVISLGDIFIFTGFLSLAFYGLFYNVELNK